MPAPIPQSPPIAVPFAGLEALLLVIFVAAAFISPLFGASAFSRIQRRFRTIAQKRIASVAVIGFSAVALRIAVLPIHPVPVPLRPDEFSNLLAADTFLHGRLTNPTPAMWKHFETIHVDMVPTYMSMYFPAQGLLLAAGKALFGDPWFGVMIGGAAMCAAICWMLQAWLPLSWAFLGGSLAVLRIALFSYWTNTYDNAGPIAAIGGALLLGSLPRLKKVSSWHLLVMAVGVILLVLTRPYEGLLLCLPVAACLVGRILTNRSLWSRKSLLQALPALALLVAGFSWLGYYDYRVFGSPSTLPYTVNRATYATAQYFVWQQPRAEPHYRHEEMRRFYKIEEFDHYRHFRSPSGFAQITLIKALVGICFFAGAALVPTLFMFPWALRDRRVRFLVIACLILGVGMLAEVYMFPHYLAPFTAAFYAIGIQAMRHLYCWKLGYQPVGKAITRWMITVCILMAAIRPFNRRLNVPVPERPVSTSIINWFGADHFVTQRSVVEQRLRQLPGQQLAIVRYSSDHDPLDEWVYNEADINESKVIWARAMDFASDTELLEYYSNRKAWLIQPDSSTGEMIPYPVPAQVTGPASR